MKDMRTRILPKMLNSEVEDYLKENDIIIVPVGTVEMHGGFPLDSETVISEAIAMKMAQDCDGLLLTGLPYFYAGATASGRGTVQVSIRQGIDYLGAIARSLLRQGFKRQIYISFHGPAYMTCTPMIRDFFDETGIPVLYMDLSLRLFQKDAGLIQTMDSFHAITVAAYDIMGRIADIPLTTEYYHTQKSSVAPYQSLFDLAYQNGSIGFCFGAQEDHMSTPEIATSERRLEFAGEGKILIERLVENMGLRQIVAEMRSLEKFQAEVMERFPWMPAAFHPSAR